MMLMTKCLPTFDQSTKEYNQQQQQPTMIKSIKNSTIRKHNMSGDGDQRYERPALSYKDLIIEAIENSPDKRLKLNEIYNVIRILHPYYRMRPDQWGWQNSIRHNLSLHDCFVKLPLKETTSNGVVGHYWTVVPEAIDKITIGSSGSVTTTRRRSRVDRTANNLLRNPLKITANNSRSTINRRASLQQQHPTIELAPPLSAGLFFSKFLCNTTASSGGGIFHQSPSSTVTTITTVAGNHKLSPSPPPSPTPIHHQPSASLFVQPAPSSSLIFDDRRSSITSSTSEDDSGTGTLTSSTTSLNQQQIIDDYRQQYTNNLLQSFFYTQGLMAALAHMAELTSGTTVANDQQQQLVGTPTTMSPSLTNYCIGGLQLPITRPEATPATGTVSSNSTFY